MVSLVQEKKGEGVTKITLIFFVDAFNTAVRTTRPQLQ